MTADLGELTARLRGIATTDHERGCDGRCYACSCGWDEENAEIATQAANAIETLSARLRAAEGALRPFAACADTVVRDFRTAGGTITPSDADVFPAGPITWGHLRAARAVLPIVGGS